jgi:hypothetical protein
MRQGLGVLLLAVGSALVYDDSSKDGSSVGAGLGLLLVLAGSGLVLDFPAGTRDAS